MTRRIWENVSRQFPQVSTTNQKDSPLIQVDDPESYHGAPAAIQLIGRRLDEDRLLFLADIVVEALARWREKQHNGGR